MTARLKLHRRLAGIAVFAMLPAFSFGEYFGGTAPASAEAIRPPARARPVMREQVLPRPRPNGAAPSAEPEIGVDPIAQAVELLPGFGELARRSGEPQVPGLVMVYLYPLGLPADAKQWRNIIVHQTEGPAGSAKSMALAQSKNPTKRGVTVWVETDGTVYWSTPETVIPTHGDGANRNDNKYIDNAKTYRAVVKTNSIGVEFIGNYPDVAKPATREQASAWLLLVRFLQERYDIPAENIYAHNWIDFKDRRYCEGCDLAALARKLAYEPGKRANGEKRKSE
jgi:N-acetylmuramoyl-L-alanine amidase-like protein